jgi:glycogen debranching enzyme
VQGAQQAFAGMAEHLNDACIGTISEIFDADAPFTPRGCVAQAWSVAEVLRVAAKLAAHKATADVVRTTAEQF